MTQRQADYVPHGSQLPVEVKGYAATTAASSSLNFHDPKRFLFFVQGTKRRSVIWRPVRSIVALGVASWVQYQSSENRNPPKATVQMDGLPTKWSETFFQKLHQRFGRQTRRRISRRLSDAACVRLKDIWADSVNGRAMPWPSSSKRSQSVTVCGTFA
jgi:hypothetical protein